jgi:hypothetical protein
MPCGHQLEAGCQVCARDVHDPRGTPRTIRPSAAITTSTLVVMLRFTSHFLPDVGSSSVRSRGSSADNWAAVARPRFVSARSTDDSSDRSQPWTSAGSSGSVGMVLSCWISRVRCWAAMSSDAAWCTTGT